MSADEDDREKDEGSAYPGAEIIPLRRTRPCAICGLPSIRAFHPFCSQRCADLDLSRWLNGSYVIPAAAEPEEAESTQLLDEDDEADY